MATEAESLTIHGLGRVFGSRNRSMQLFWGVVFIICTAFAISNLYDNWTSYLQYQTVLSSKSEVQSSMMFPAVTICNGLKRSSMEPTFTKGFHSFIQSHQNFCRFDGRSCNASGIEVRDLSEKSALICLRINENQTARQITPAVRWGLSVDFYLNVSDKISSDLDYSDPPTEAIKIYLDKSANFPSIFDTPILAKPGFLTEVAVTRVITKRLKFPYPSKCQVEKGEDFFPGDYTLKGCLLSLWIKDIYLKCGSVHPAYDYFFPYHLFTRKRANDTLVEECVQHYHENGTEINSASCNQPCYEELYKVSAVTESKWPVGSEKIRMKRIINASMGIWPEDDFVSSNFGRLMIGYDKFEVRHIEEIPKSTIFSLVSDTGGIFGICLGASFISLLELIVISISKLATRLTKVSADLPPV